MTIECKLQRNIHTYLQTHIHSDKERERKESKNNSNTIAQANEVANTTRKKDA